jgi:DNA-binding CsgD family transcriptional regulator
MDERFNQRERRVLGYMVAGLHSDEIAAELGGNGSTAKMLMNSVLVELGANGERNSNDPPPTSAVRR